MNESRKMMMGGVMAFAVALALTAAGTTPEEAFAAPPPEAHVGVWWHWMGGQVSRKGVGADDVIGKLVKLAREVIPKEYPVTQPSTFTISNGLTVL